MTPVVGPPLTRIDGPAKVTGRARYAADFDAPRMAHAELVTSTIAKGRIAAMGLPLDPHQPLRQRAFRRLAFRHRRL